MVAILVSASAYTHRSCQLRHPMPSSQSRGGWVIRRQIGHDVVIHSERLGGVHGLTPD